jgi:hypothetical protein
MEYKCNICNKLYSSYQSLWIHNKKFHNPNVSIKEINVSKIGQTVSIKKSGLNCKFCNKIFSTPQNRWKHENKVCKNKKLNIQLEKQNEEIKKLKEQLNDKITNVTNNTNNGTINTHLIDIIVDKSNTIIDLKNKNTKLKENNVTNNLIVANSIPTTLTLNDVVIVSRTEDNYINATQLCQAGNKKFNHWYSLETTKQLINEAASDAGIPVSQLVDIKKGNTNEFSQGSWVHPDLAIQLAQWLSPRFALQVSKWIRTLFTNGNVSIDVKILEDQHTKEIKLKDQKIQLLQDIYVKKQKRQDYPEKNVIYILSTEDNKKKRIYIIGKTKKLKDRLGPYNKTAEHGVEYYKSCYSKENMNIVEAIVLTKLDKYREKANRDRFILPVEKELSLFTNIIENSINYLIT